MQVIHTIAEFRKWRRSLAPTALTPFAPTMGALHEGHASLIRHARQIADASPAQKSTTAVLSSIFVNPTQFGPSEDFAQYPRTLEADLALLEQNGCDAVFVPSAQEMYPHLTRSNSTAIVNAPLIDTFIDPGPLGTILEGAIRPTHFRGVCTVVAKLLLIVQPTRLLLGQKDFQQQAILRQMCVDLNFPTQVITCPTFRQPDGLAMSSRNRYLSPADRPRAVALFQALSWAKSAIEQGERSAALIDAGMQERISAQGLVVQYALAADPQTLHPFHQTPMQQISLPAVLLVAAKLGPTRLIDNMLVAPGHTPQVSSLPLQ